MRTVPRAFKPNLFKKRVAMRLTSLVCAVSLLCATSGLADDARKTVAVGSSALKGSGKAPITMVVFSDFECPFCARIVPTLTELESKYPGKLKIAFRQLPLPFHKNARLAAAASLAAGEQGKFWPMHDLLFSHPAGLERAALVGYAKSLKLDVAKFGSALDSGRFDKQIEADTADAAQLGANGTPTVFVNGRPVVGAQPTEAFQKIIDEELQAAR